MNTSFKSDPYDSKIFGFRVAKILSIEDSVKQRQLDQIIKKLIKDLMKNKFVYATYRVAANKFLLIHSLEKNGFILVDGLISLELKIDDAIFEDIPEVRKATHKDKKSLESLASSSFYLNRVFNDQVIARSKANDFYKKWVSNSLAGYAADLVLIWEEKGIKGFTTLEKSGHIPLTAVSSEARGKGIAKKLTKATFSYFKKWKVKKILIETQMGNIPALRAYQSCGFKIINSHLTFRWARSNLL